MNRESEGKSRGIPLMPKYGLNGASSLRCRFETGISMTQLLWARNTLLFCWCLAGVLLAASPTLRGQTMIAQLKTQFEHPPDDSRPLMRWWWFGVAVEKPEIRRELEEMKAD